MTSIHRGTVVTRDAVLSDGVVVIDGDRIEWVGPAADLPNCPAPQSDRTILPGMIDVHCHGGGGVGFPEADADGARAAVDFHRRGGTTTMLASLVSAPPAVLMRQAAVLAELRDSGDIDGVHLEGPFLARSRCGAQDPRSILAGDPALFEDIVAAARGAVRSMTLAPETSNASALAAAMAARGVLPSFGHTDADAALVTASLPLFGPRVSATHLFNGMPPMHHRAPGPAAACLAAAARGEMVLELIGDGVHLAPETVSMVVDLVGPEQVTFVSDAMAAAGMSDGAYRLGALDVTVEGGVARLAGESGAIAGGTATVLDIVRRAVTESGIDLVAAVRMGSDTPARLLGREDVGRLERGLIADLVITDADLNVHNVIRRGQVL